MCMKKTILIALVLCMTGSMASFANVVAVHEDDFEDRELGSNTEGWLWYDNAASHVGLYVDFEGSIVQEHSGTLRSAINQRFGYKTDIEMDGNTSEDPCDYTFELDIRNLQGNWDPHLIEIWVLTYNPDTGGSTYGYGLPILELYQADEWVHVTANLGDLVELGRTWWEGTGWDMTNPTWSYEIGGPPWPGVEVVGEPWTQIFLVDNLKITMFAEPPEFAREPVPENESIDIPRDVVLSWTPGIYADTRNVYFGTVFNDVNEASPDNPLGVLVGPDQQETTYDPPGLLDYNQTYYWRVDEVNDTEPNSPWRGKVWSFTVANFILIEDFEDYNDYPPNEVWNTWTDGYGDPLNGSSAGYPDPDFVAGEHYLDDIIVHSGDWSMPVFYDNSTAPLSEVTRTVDSSVSNWTVDDVITLTLFYQGDAANIAEPMYVVVDGVVVTNDNANAALATEWTRWDIPLQSLADQGVNLNNVGSLTIGFGNKANPSPDGSSGHVFFDDIRLYRAMPEPEPEPEPVEPAEPVDPGTEGLIAYYPMEGDVSDASGNGNDGTIIGNPGFVDGIAGQAIDLDGAGDYVDCGDNPLLGMQETNEMTAACWVTIRSIPAAWAGIVAKGEHAWRMSNVNLDPRFHFGISFWQEANPSIDGVTAVGYNEWHHVAGVYDGASVMVYLDGLLDASVETPTPIMANEFNVEIGRNPEGTDRTWDGLIDELMIYNRALSAGEVLYLASQ
jgi:hypothetical protein